MIEATRTSAGARRTGLSLGVLFFAVLSTAFMAERALAQPAPLGPEFLVNTTTTDQQWHSSVAATGNGTFVVIWDTTTGNPDGSQGAVFGQRYDGNGLPIGTEFQINAYTTGRQCCADVTAANDGSFAVAWQDSGRDGNFEGVFGRRFDSNANPLGTEFQINTYTTGIQWDIDTSGASDGSFVVTWADDSQLGGRDQINARRYDTAGNPAGTQFRVNSYTTGDKQVPRVASADDGSFVVAWTSYLQDGSDAGAFARRFDSSGTPTGTDMQVNQYTTGDQTVGSVESAPDGRFVVGFTSPQDGSGAAAMARRYDSSGAALGAPFQVNTFTTGTQGTSDLAMAPDGSFVAVFHDFTHDGNGAGVFARNYDSAGNAEGTEFQVNTYTTSDQTFSSVDMADDGNFLVTWRSGNLFAGGDGSDSGIFGQFFSQRCGAAPEPDGACHLADISGLGKQSLGIKNSSDDTKDSLKWKWGKGSMTDLSEFASPDVGSASYTLCIYDGSASPQPLLQASIPPNGEVPLCGTAPCWKAAGSGYKYKNKIGTDQGINSVSLKAGSAGKAQVQVKAKGALLQPPATAGLTNVVVQLLIDNGITTECFKTSFPNGLITTQDGDDFKVKGP